MAKHVHPANYEFKEDGATFEVLHEYDILVTQSFEYYIVVAIFGMEYTLNLGGREIEGYTNWLKENKYISPLYCGKNVKNRDNSIPNTGRG